MFMVESEKDLGTSKMELILGKIAMPSPMACLPRPRLQAILEQSLSSCTSTILSGRAGTGKTSLAIDFAEKSGRSVAWYKVDAPDSELLIFFQYLIASISKQRLGFGVGALLPLLWSATPDRMPLVAEAFVYELEREAGKPLLVVIEDLHLVCDAIPSAHAATMKSAPVAVIPSVPVAVIPLGPKASTPSAPVAVIPEVPVY